MEIRDAFLSPMLYYFEKKVNFKSRSEGFEITIPYDLVLRMEDETGRKACTGVQS